MKRIAEVIKRYSADHSREQTVRLIRYLICADTPKDDHGHWFKEENAVCPHGRKPREALRSTNKHGKIRNAIGSKAIRLSKQEKDFRKQTDNQLLKGIRSHEKQIRKHEEYVKNPKTKYPEWDSFPEKRKARELRHWQTEINAFMRNVENRREELERRREGR